MATVFANKRTLVLAAISIVLVGLVAIGVFIRMGKPGNADLVAKGKERFQANKCFDCHGPNGEGTEDGPNLTETKKSPDEIAAFLQKPSSDARQQGMPTIPQTSPEFQPLVAYVLSLKKTPSP